MNTAVANQPTTHRHRLSGGALWLLGLIIGSIIGGYVVYRFTVQSNTKMVFQDHQLTEVQSFDASGGTLDNAVRPFGNALAGRGSVEDARGALSGAIGAHSSVAFALRERIGAPDYDSYTRKLGDLQRLVASARTREEGVQVWQVASDLIAQRARITSRLRQEIEGS